jgi:hypothetical protein
VLPLDHHPSLRMTQNDADVDDFASHPPQHDSIDKKDPPQGVDESPFKLPKADNTSLDDDCFDGNCLDNNHC